MIEVFLIIRMFYLFFPDCEIKLLTDNLSLKLPKNHKKDTGSSRQHFRNYDYPTLFDLGSNAAYGIVSNLWRKRLTDERRSMTHDR